VQAVARRDAPSLYAAVQVRQNMSNNAAVTYVTGEIGPAPSLASDCLRRPIGHRTHFAETGKPTSGHSLIVRTRHSTLHKKNK